MEKERLTREAAEHHTNATAETQKLVEEAEQRANAAEARGREAIAAATSDRKQAQEEVRPVAEPRPSRGRADRLVRPDPGGDVHRGRQGGGRARAEVLKADVDR